MNPSLKDKTLIVLSLQLVLTISADGDYTWKFSVAELQ
jgi:hypothetical protein